ncbi:amidohydrolase family protein [Pelagibacterium montanilacus]|uniref:amidohydrolase family protein n=1 Tax=Pelagibacterium montanilacus TaxID=2185280 RepID=UPI000F8E51A1|nr:amidohydrolase family protein [Pelagibacterium montanilacus]
MFDVHTHMLRPPYWGEEYERNWKGPYGSDWQEPSVEAFDAAMNEAGITFAVVFGITAKAAGVHSPTPEVAAFCERLKTPNVCFMALDPADPDWRRSFDEGVAHGARGIKLYPVMARFDPRDEAHDAFYRAASGKGLPILWHMGATPSAQGDLSVSHPLVLDQVARRFPDLKQIIAHMGHPWQRDTVQVLRKNPNVYADISGVWTRPMDGYLALVNAQEWGCVHKLLFGSDYPLWTPQETIEGLRRLTKVGSEGFPRVMDETIDTILACDLRRSLGL